MLRVNSEDPKLAVVDFDVNGNPLYHYMGQPFTGIMEVYYSTGILEAEYEKDNGSEWGVQREYHPNGILRDENHIGPGGLHGRWREWDDRGNLISDKMWINGIEQP